MCGSEGIKPRNKGENVNKTLNKPSARIFEAGKLGARLRLMCHTVSDTRILQLCRAVAGSARYDKIESWVTRVQLRRCARTNTAGLTQADRTCSQTARAGRRIRRQTARAGRRRAQVDRHGDTHALGHGRHCRKMGTYHTDHTHTHTHSHTLTTHTRTPRGEKRGVSEPMKSRERSLTQLPCVLCVCFTASPRKPAT